VSSKHVSLKLHEPEEQVHVLITDSVRQVPVGNRLNPISDYFDATSRLKGKILTAANAQDAELLGLMIVGVISAAEFYFRSILGRMVQICPLCSRLAENAQVPMGSFGYYMGSDYCFALSAMEHESLADAERVATYIKRLTGFKTTDDSSVVAALEGYDVLCEVRHCLTHARGFVGLKGSRALGLNQRSLSKVLVAQEGALELLKLSHNGVRAVNRFLFDSLVDRWIDRDVLRGNWAEDRVPFGLAWRAFFVSGEDAFNGNLRTAYSPVRRVVAKRKEAIAAKA
jgi:hypothetical protein